MTIDRWLRVGAIGMPLAGALIMWRWGAGLPSRRQLAVSILGTTGMLALALFLLNRHYACILAFGRESCLLEGSATLSLLLLSVFLTRRCIVLRRETVEPEIVPLLLLSGAWAGIGLAENGCLFLLFLNLLVFAVDRWLASRGISWRFLAIRDDYKDDTE